MREDLRIVRALAGLWAGLILGGSLIAAPAKFRAASLARSVALDVGQHQFFWINVVECALGCLWICAIWRLEAGRWRWPVAMLAVFTVQQALIMPPLHERSLQVIAGAQLGPSSLHWIYIGLELVKLCFLGSLALGLVRVSDRDD